MSDEPSDGMILIDVSAGADGLRQAELLTRFGHPVRVCHGPDHDGRCPLLEGRDCPDFDAAHGVIFELDLDQPAHRTLVRRYRELAREDVPIRVVVTEEQAQRYADELRDVEVVTHVPTTADLDGFAAEVEAPDRF